MTTIITRLFPDQKAAQSAADRLTFKGVPRRACSVITGGSETAAKLARAQVHPSAMTAYQKGLGSGNAVLVVEATYKPLGVLQMAREILAKTDAIQLKGVTEENHLPWTPEKATSVLKDHPHMLTVPGVAVPHGPITSNFGMSMLKPHSTKRPLTNRRISRAFWPMKLVSQKRRSSSVMSGKRYMSRMFWPMPLLSNKSRSKSVIPGGGLVMSRLLGMRPLS